MGRSRSSVDSASTCLVLAQLPTILEAASIPQLGEYRGWGGEAVAARHNLAPVWAQLYVKPSVLWAISSGSAS